MHPYIQSDIYIYMEHDDHKCVWLDYTYANNLAIYVFIEKVINEECLETQTNGFNRHVL